MVFSLKYTSTVVVYASIMELFFAGLLLLISFAVFISQKKLLLATLIMTAVYMIVTLILLAICTPPGAEPIHIWFSLVCGFVCSLPFVLAPALIVYIVRKLIR